MTTYTALTTLDDRASAEALANAMEGMTPEPTGIGCFEIEDGSERWEVGGYFIDAPDEAGLAVLAAAFGARPFVVSEVPETDWVAKVKRDLAPVEAGRFFVHGSHDADKIPEGSEPLLIEAAMAFGTGHHGTTLGCLKALDELINDGVVAQNVADVGCGTAVLAMAAARVFPNPALAWDIDEVAVDVARANVAANGMEGRVHCFEATGFDDPQIAAKAPFDLVFANILKGPLIALAEDFSTHMQSNGHLILSGLLNEQAEDIIAHYARFGFNLRKHAQIGDWSTLILTLQR